LMARKRIPIKASVRRAVWVRDAGLCGVCLLPVPYESMEVDHVHPHARGGSDDADNLRPAHPLCNRRRFMPGSVESPRTTFFEDLAGMGYSPEVIEEYRAAISEAGRRGGKARAAKTTREQRAAIGRKAGAARWRLLDAEYGPRED
jgi:hypothetical protein